MTAGGRPGQTLLAIGPLPPPVHGYSLITSLVIERLQRAVSVEVVNIAPQNLVRGWLYHLTRMRRAAAALWALLRRPAHGRALYLAIAGGAGVLYDIPFAAAARLRGHRIFIHHNAFTYLTRRSRWTAMLVALAGRDSTHICLCPTMARRLREHYPRARHAVVLSNAALVAPAGVARPTGGGGFRIGFLSNLIPEKGLDTAIATLAALCERRTDVTLVVAGPIVGPSAQQMIDAAKQRFGCAFDYRGAVYGAEKTRFFHDVDVLLFPSRYANEAQPLVVLEALAHGVPVIATARGCIPDDLTEGGIVVFPETEFVPAAVAAIMDWCAEPLAFSRLRDAAYAHSVDMHRAAQGHLDRLIGAMSGVRS
jgi:glycosyltransferase involved in cell wall biosynthesis